MKIIKEDKKTRTVTLRINEDVIQKVDEVADENKVSRQRLIEAILEQILSDKKFILHLQ